MPTSPTDDLLERIACALERIADSLNQTSSPPEIRHSYAASSQNGTAEHPQSPESPALTPDGSPSILAFLASRGIQVKSFQAKEELDDVLDTLAAFMGNRYPYIKKLYETIKRDTNQGKGFQLLMKNASQEEVSYSCHLGHSLHKIAFLSNYKYLKAPKFLYTGRVNRIPTAINFLTGQWLERYIKTEIIQVIRKQSSSLPYSYLMNPRITLPNGDDFELDVLFEVDGEIFWFEAKTGEYQQYVNKYKKMAQVLGLDSEHAFMVLLDVSEQDCMTLQKLFSMQVVNQAQFSEVFQASLLPLVDQQIQTEAHVEENTYAEAEETVHSEEEEE